jgi:formylglycine-generating enzyme required for sulfatase activity
MRCTSRMQAGSGLSATMVGASSARFFVASFSAVSISAGLAGASLPPPPAGVQVTTRYGIEFSTVSSPGNVPYHVGPNDPSTVERDVGSVPYSYALSRTEITTAQWFDFVQAYKPYYTGAPNDSAFTGVWINYSPSSGYSYSPQDANKPVDVSWYMAARYCNWLCNNKATTQAAFNSGAYDASTFAANPTDQPVLDQPAHTPGAQFWIPTQDEWIKGAYYDPNRYGAGSGGYWPFPNRSDMPPIPGVTTNAGLTSDPNTPVANYPDAQSAWGLFDISGGEKEWTESLSDPGFERSRYLLGSVAGDALYTFYDRIGWEAGDLAQSGWPQTEGGIRIASIPANPSGAVLLIGVLAFNVRKRT